MRYQFYREHKLVSSALNDLERLMATTDFCDFDALEQVKMAFQSVAHMLTHHAAYENVRVHRLLKEKGSSLHLHAEEEHALQTKQLDDIFAQLDQLSIATDDTKKIKLGYKIYLTYRKFLADNLLHLHEEESLILPELQRLYSDDELQKVAAIAYREMTPEQIVHMLQGLFPHMNKYDRKAFMENIAILEPEKLAHAWPNIRMLLNEHEQKEFGEIVIAANNRNHTLNECQQENSPCCP